MPTSIHIPPPLLAAVDRKARALQISRSRLIMKALQREVDGAEWSPDFFDRLRPLAPDVASTLDESLAAVRNTHRSKKPVRL